MNCPNCNAPLDARARFCTKCGKPVAAAAANNVIAHAQPPASTEPPTLPLSRPQDPAPLQQQPLQAMWTPPPPQPQPVGGPQQQAQPAYYLQQGAPNPELNTLASSGSIPRRRRGGCLIAGLLTPVILALLVAAGWFFALRPYLHTMAQNQIDQAFSQAVQQMPSQLSQVPAGPFTFTDDIFNNLIQLNLPPNSVVKQMVAHTTPSNVRIDFQVYGMPCDVTGVPQVVNKQLVVTNVQVDGIIGLLMSNDEMTIILNKHLADAQVKLNRSILAVQLEDQKMILTLGPTSSTPSTPPLP
jgi:hypothetical protein